jgi:hypothetical protein
MYSMFQLAMTSLRVMEMEATCRLGALIALIGCYPWFQRAARPGQD